MIFSLYYSFGTITSPSLWGQLVFYSVCFVLLCSNNGYVAKFVPPRESHVLH